MKFFFVYKTNAKKIALVLAIVAGLATLIGNIDTIYTKINKWISKASSKLVVERILVVAAGHSKADEFGSWKLKSLTKAEFLKTHSYIDLIDGAFPKYHYVMDNGERGETGGGVASLNDAGIFLYHLEWSFDTDELVWDNFKNTKPFPKHLMHLIMGTAAYDVAVNNRDLTVEQRNVHLYWALYEQLGRDLKHPEIRIIIRNDGNKAATFYGVKSINLYSFGGEAGAGGAELKPINSDRVIDINYTKPGYLKLKNPIVLDPGTSTIVAIVPNVIDAAQGDGPGDIIVNWTLDYHDGIKNRVLNLGNFYFEDSVMELASF